MQRLADELAAEGLVRFTDNPKHRRSKLVQLKPEGDARYRALRRPLAHAFRQFRKNVLGILPRRSVGSPHVGCRRVGDCGVQGVYSLAG
jgi:hypothetical protein